MFYTIIILSETGRLGVLYYIHPISRGGGGGLALYTINILSGGDLAFYAIFILSRGGGGGVAFYTITILSDTGRLGVPYYHHSI